MPLYAYKAMREDGSSVAEETMAPDELQLRQELEGRGYFIVSLAEKKTSLRMRGGDPKEFLIFNQEFITLIKAGLPVVQSLEILQKRTDKPGFNSALTAIISHIKGGAALSEAMEKHPSYFPPLYTATVRAGEKSGALVNVLQRFIAYQKKMLSVRRKLVTALAYPVFLVAALCAVMLLFFLYIIPNFTQMYGDHQGSLPLLTMILISFTEAVTRHAPLILAGIVVTVFGLYWWRRTPAGRAALDGMALRIPVASSLLTQYMLAQLTRTLASVLRGGIPLVQALDTTAGVISNSVVAERLKQSRRLLTEGVSLATAFERTGIAPEMTVRMIEVGESSGDLPQMLEDVAEFYDQEVENRMTMITTMIEPVLMLTMGIVIAIIVVALYLPIFEMGAQLK